MAMAQTDSFDAETPVIEAIQSGDQYAFRELVRRHTRWVRGSRHHADRRRPFARWCRILEVDQPDLAELSE